MWRGPGGSDAYGQGQAMGLREARHVSKEATLETALPASVDTTRPGGEPSLCVFLNF